MNLFRAALFCGLLAYIVYYLQSPKKSYNVTIKLNDTYDYIIIGAGSAGAVLASRLSEDPEVTVLLLEAGGDGSDNAAMYEIPVMAPLLAKSASDWQYESAPHNRDDVFINANKDKHHYIAGKVLGGSSMFNYMQYNRGSKYDYDKWAENGCSGWSYDEVLPYFLKSEDYLGQGDETLKYHNKGGPLGVSLETVFPDLTRRFIEAGNELGFKEVDVNAEDQIGFGVSQVNVRNGVRASTMREFLHPVMNRENLHVAVNAHATKVNINDKNAAGVTFVRNGIKRYVSVGKEVIVSAGSIGSPQILMLSGIGPKEHLRSLNISVVQDLPVGENLQNHLMFVFPSDINATSDSLTMSKLQDPRSYLKYRLLSSGIFASTGSVGNAFVKTESQTEKFPDIHFNMLALQPNLDDDSPALVKSIYRNGSFPGISLFLFLLHPESRGKVILKSTDPFDYPVIDSNYFEMKEDIEVLKRGIRMAEKLLETKPMKQIGTDSHRFKDFEFCSQHHYRSEEFYECLVKHLSQTAYHQTSTCRMGAHNDPTAVVDPTLKVKGVKGLRVVDASVIPYSISGNTNAPVIMIAEKAADMIQGKDSVKDIRRKLADNN